MLCPYCDLPIIPPAIEKFSTERTAGSSTAYCSGCTAVFRVEVICLRAPKPDFKKNIGT